MTEDKEFYLSEEVLIVRHSGEIPEVAYHGSVFFLTADPEGPQLLLDDRDLALLKDQVIARYRELILRDLTPANRDKSIYRGLKRCITNWQRLCRFCANEHRETTGVRTEVAAALERFLVKENKDIAAGRRTASINCTAAELDGFRKELGLAPEALPEGWQRLCPN